MGIWTTLKNPKGHKVNICNYLINSMKEQGAKFCWMIDNPGINNKDSNYYVDEVAEDKVVEDKVVEDKVVEDKVVDKVAGEEGEVVENVDKVVRKLKDNIIVSDEDGNTVTGYIIHIVNGYCYGTDIKDWFIIQPGTYPRKYIIR